MEDIKQNPFYREQQRIQRLRRSRFFALACIAAVWMVAMMAMFNPSAAKLRFSTGGRFHHEPSRFEEWDKWTAMGSVRNGERVTIWRQLWDKENNRMRFDSARVNRTPGHESISNETLFAAAESIFDGYQNGNEDLFEGVSVMTGLFLEDGIYGIYKNAEGKPACRTYPRKGDLPDLDWTEGATDNGLEYVGVHLVHHFSNLNLPDHDDDEVHINNNSTARAMKIENSDLWVRPFTGIPAAAKFEGTWEWRGKTGEFSLVYHFFRVSRWVNSLMFELPEPIVDLCGGDDEEKQEEKERTMEMTSYMFPGFVMI